MLSAVVHSEEAPDLWRALANPTRRLLLDELGQGPRTTGDLAATLPELSRFAVMQHLGVLVDAGLVVVRRRGRERFNYLNPVPLRRWYERWVTPFADRTAAELLALQRSVEGPTGGTSMPVATEEIRTVRIETVLRFRATPDRICRAITQESLRWFPHTYGGERVRGIVFEPLVGGAHYEDWGDGQGHLYGTVTEWDAPRAWSTRGMRSAGSILDTSYELEPDGDETILRVSKVAVGPMTDEEAAGYRRFGDIANFEDALRAVVEG